MEYYYVTKYWAMPTAEFETCFWFKFFLRFLNYSDKTVGNSINEVMQVINRK